MNSKEGFGAASPKNMIREIAAEKADLGVALDGDGDRVLIVDAAGRAYDGDQLLYAVAKHRAAKEKVAGVAGTVVTNLAFENAMRRLGIGLGRAQGGGRYVLEVMRGKGWQLGGGKSGDIICLHKHTPRAGLLAA